MHAFLQRMLRRNDEETRGSADCEADGRGEEIAKTGAVKRSWMKKLGNCSPSKYKIPASSLKTEAMKNLEGNVSRRNACPSSATPKKVPVLPNPPLEMPDLESIIREFEMGFVSSSKNNLPTETSRGNFVKKIVAAFEVKYKAYNELRAEEEVKEIDEKIGTEERKVGVFSSPLKLCPDSAKNTPRKAGMVGPAASRIDRESPRSIDKISRMFSSPRRRERSEESRKLEVERVSGTRQEEKKNSVREVRKFPTFQIDCEDSSLKGTTMVSSTPTKDVSEDCEYLRRRSALCTSPLDLHSQETSSSSSSSSNNATYSNLSISCPYLSESDDSSLHATTPTRVEPRFVDWTSANIATTTTRRTRGKDNRGEVEDFSPTDKSRDFEENASKRDHGPKIIGAFLKRPIEVDDTAIDWIPITGKRLPRKRSLKKLLSVLRSRRISDKRDPHLFSSQRNVSEETREHQDSGYDERSSSSSSTTSLLSITEALLHHENTCVESSRTARVRPSLGTFRPRNTREAGHQDEPETRSKIDRRGGTRTSGKIVLSEVPRERLTADLGPCLPTDESVANLSKLPETGADGPRRISACSMTTMSLDRRSLAKTVNSRPLPKHPTIRGTVPKHPFVSHAPELSADRVASTPINVDFPGVELRRKTPIGAPTVRIRNSLYEVEFRRSFDGFPSPKCYRDSCASIESIYDVPRRFMSKSDTGLPGILEHGIFNGRRNEPIYDVPKFCAAQRPRSSVYEDAISLKRRTDQLTCPAPNFYADVDDDEEPHYATIKPRNRRTYRSEEILKRDLRCFDEYRSISGQS